MLIIPFCFFEVKLFPFFPLSRLPIFLFQVQEGHHSRRVQVSLALVHFNTSTCFTLLSPENTVIPCNHRFSIRSLKNYRLLKILCYIFACTFSQKRIHCFYAVLKLFQDQNKEQWFCSFYQMVLLQQMFSHRARHTTSGH